MGAFGEALGLSGHERQQKLDEAADSLRQELEQLGAKVTALALVQPPTSLLGYIWAQAFVDRLRDHVDEQAEQAREGFEHLQFALEYLHAVWSGNCGPFPEGSLDEEKAKELLDVFSDFRTKTQQFCLISSVANSANANELQSDLEFQAKSSWVLIRGHRHQVLEEEFFRFALAPHDEALREAYGVNAAEIASGMQQIADSFRAGHAKAAEIIAEQQEQAFELARRDSISLEAAIEKLKEHNP